MHDVVGQHPFSRGIGEELPSVIIIAANAEETGRREMRGQEREHGAFPKGLNEGKMERWGEENKS